MRCIAVIDTSQQAFDTVIIWDRGTQLVAMAYADGQVHKSRALEAASLEDAVTEIRDAYGIAHGYLTRVTHWSPRLETPMPPFPDKWVLS